MPTSIDPRNGETLREYAYFDASETQASLAAAHARFASWRRRPLAARAQLIAALAGVLRAQREPAARLMSAEMGKPISQARGELDKCAWLCEWIAEHGPALLADEEVASDARRSYVSYQPLGALLAIMPWNFPWWQALRFALPALLAGNTVVLKHAPNTTGCGLAIAQALREAGFPAGCLETVIIEHEVAGQLIEDPRIAGVTLTGSTRAGRAVAAIAGRALKKSVLELGGSDPYVVLADADLDHAARVCAAARLHNSGQTCVAAKRFVVVDAVAERFVELVRGCMAAARVGDPREEETAIGPLARHDLRATLHEQVERSVAAGARLLLGGQLPEGPGAYYPPTLLDHVEPGMVAAEQELFGPAAAVMRVADEAAALRIANATPYGLGAAVFTQDLERGESIAREHLDAGCCFLNSQVKSDPRLPFGGVKASGIGRELGRAGMLEWVNVKTVYLA